MPDLPIVGAALYRKVMERADWQCECRGKCGKSHGHDIVHKGRWPGRCRNHWSRQARLAAIAAVDGNTYVSAAKLKDDGLMAACPDCHKGIDKARMITASEEPEGLF